MQDIHDICTIYHYLSKMGRKHAISCILFPEMSKFLDFYIKIILNPGLYSDQDYIQIKIIFRSRFRLNSHQDSSRFRARNIHQKYTKYAWFCIFSKTASISSLSVVFSQVNSRLHVIKLFIFLDEDLH